MQNNKIILMCDYSSYAIEFSQHIELVMLFNRANVWIDIVNYKFSSVPARINPIHEIENELQ